MGYAPVTHTEKAAVDRQFPRLKRLLAGMVLPTSDGKYRKTSADEFMLMSSPTADNADFKHSFTRRYVYVREINGVDVLMMEKSGYYDDYPEF